MTPSPGAIACAAVAIRYWVGQDLEIAVAIPGRESGWNPDAEGDVPSRLLAEGSITEAQYLALLPYTCPPNSPDQPTSFGGWQINSSNIGILPYADPCQNRAWLLGGWPNNGHAAYMLWRADNGWSSWTSYTSGAYAEYLDEARAAIAAVQGSPPAPRLPAWPWVVGGLAAAGVGGWLWSRTPSGRRALAWAQARLRAALPER